MLFAVTALILSSATPAELDPATMRRDLIGHVQRLDAQLKELRGKINDGFMTNLDKPETGMLVNVSDVGDENGLHPVSVVAVFGGGPAAKAGIKSGDRILAIGPRKLEHETKTVVELLLEGQPGPVTVTVRRGPSTVDLTIDRHPLACLREAIGSVDKRWRLNDVKQREARVAEISRELADRDADFRKLTRIAREVESLWKSFEEMVTPLRTYVEDINQAAVEVCRIQ